MTTPEADALLAVLDAGGVLRVPFSTTLYPDTVAHRSTLRRDGDGFELTTYYSEVATGHGASAEMTQREFRSRAQVRESLEWARREDCVAA